jgi:hypothetical protein
LALMTFSLLPERIANDHLCGNLNYTAERPPRLAHLN